MWRIISEVKETENHTSYTAYGVRNGDYCLADFSSSKTETERFADLLNKYEVSTVHASDIAEDYFGSAEFLNYT